MRSNVTAAVIEARTLGRSEVTAPRVALGCGNFGGVGSSPEFFGRGLDEAAAFAVMDAAWELGINHFDTADAYGGGRSETTIGNWIRSRGQLPLLTTKTYNPMAVGADHGLAPERMTRQLHASLARLGVERVDLYLTHEFDPDVAPAAVVATLERFRDEGLIGAVGVSNYDAAQLRATLDAGPLDAIQNSYSLLARGDEAEVLPLCEKEGIGQIVFSPIAQGVLTGKYLPGSAAPEGSRATDAGGSRFIKGYLTDDILGRVQQLKPVADEAGLSLAQLAIAWTLQNPNVSAAIVGATRPEQVRDNVKASGVTLEESVMRSIDDILGPVIVTDPAMTASPRSRS